MLTEICAEIRNYFLRDCREDIHDGTFTISAGSIEPLSFLQEGQYYRIVGSVFNDGVWKYGAENDLKDETFSGAIWAMAVPPAVIALAEEISNWVTENAGAIASPYQSESFGGYSYTKASGYSGSGDGSGDGITWQKQFAKRLSPYRRLSVL